MAELEAKITARLVDEATGKATKIASSLAAIEKASGGATVAAGRLSALAAAEAEAEAAARRAAEAHRALAKEAGVSVADVRGLSAAAREAAASEQELAEAAERAARARAATGAAEDDAAKKAAAGAEQTRRGFGKVDAAAKQQGRALAEQVNFLTEVGLGFGMLSPATQQASIAFASAGNNAFALANALGPIGPMIALAIGTATAAAGAWAKWGSATRDAAKAAREARNAFLDQVDAAQQVAAAEQRMRELRRGERSLEEQEAALSVAKEATGARRSDLEGVTTRRVGEGSFVAQAAGALVRLGGIGLGGGVGADAAQRAAGRLTTRQVAELADLGASGSALAGGPRIGVRFIGTRTQEAAAGRASTSLDEAMREERALLVGRDRAARREATEARDEGLRSQVEGADALRASFEADVRRRFGTSERGRRQADQLLSSLDVARLDSSDRVVLDAQGSRAARGLDEGDRSAVLGRAQELLQAQRRAAAAEEQLRQGDITRVRATNATERSSDPTARPDIALREQTESLASIATRYIEAVSTDPQALPRAIEELARATAELRETAREGVRVSVATQTAGSPGRTSFAGVGTTGR